METTHVSETSTLYNHTPGNYPKEDNIRFSQHGESLKTRLEYFLTYLVALLCFGGRFIILQQHDKKVEIEWGYTSTSPL
jgi:hypothetical protein